MTQLEIQYFYPLTEQMELELDYTDCDRPKLWSTTNNVFTGSVLTSNGVTTTLANVTNAIQFMPDTESVGYWKVGEGFQMHNKKRPNWLHQKITKVFFGWEWKDK